MAKKVKEIQLGETSFFLHKLNAFDSIKFGAKLQSDFIPNSLKEVKSDGGMMGMLPQFIAGISSQLSAERVDAIAKFILGYEKIYFDKVSTTGEKVSTLLNYRELEAGYMFSSPNDIIELFKEFILYNLEDLGKYITGITRLIGDKLPLMDEAQAE